MNNQVFYTLCPKCGEKICAGVKKCPYCMEVFIKEEKPRATTADVCPKCGQGVRAGAKFCPFCAARLVSEDPPEMICPTCGRKAPAGEKYCSECGVAYEAKADQAPRAEQNNYVVPQTAPVTAARPQQGTDRISFFESFASKATKNWLKVMPVLCILSCIFCVVEMIYGLVMLASYSDAAIVLATLFWGVFAVAMGVIAYFMIKKKNTAMYVAETFVVGGNMVLTILTSYGVTLVLMIIWAVFVIGVGVYSSYALSKVDRAYNDYLRTGQVPGGQI